MMLKRTLLFGLALGISLAFHYIEGLDSPNVYPVSDKGFLLNCDSTVIMNSCHNIRTMTRE